ncbi:uric acid degradation bifunctional protein TTL-like [Arachis duranensis]|uniref:2-oxo-4-hydroxy-4-carboxy-5-ureidoimidazoline decarboxylase n=1 Tax=Arachis duranensis TaxID=130453 RepID=A0A6P4DQU5_ARADU|nr:uric acid degradation bifunctional protein TTL-like [Arachis duranensis]
METKNFSSCCAGTTFTNKMAMASPFPSLKHVITVARDIWSRKLNVRSWLEAISGRSCSNEYLEMANEATVQELHEWGSMYEERFGYVFVTFVVGRTFEDILTELKMRFSNMHVVELEIASKEELKYIERSIREFFSKKSVQTIDEGDVSAEYSGKIVDDTLDGADTNSEDNLDAISSGEYDISRNVELNKVPEEDNETLYTQHREDDVHAAKRGFDLNKKPWFGDDLSYPLSRDCSRFLIEYLWPGQYDVDEKF